MRRLLVLGVVAAALAGVIATQAVAARHGKPSVSIVKTAVAKNGVVTVTVRIANWEMVPAKVGKKPNDPAGGHWHVFVDGKYDGYSASPTTGKTTKLAAGEHTISAELANNDHSSLKPPVRSNTVTVNVAGATTSKAGNGYGYDSGSSSGSGSGY